MNARLVQGVVVIAAGAAGVGALLIEERPASAASTTSASAWTPRGDLLADKTLVESAEQTWDHERGAHTQVRVLYAGADQGVEQLVVLAGKTADGAWRIAFLSGATGYEDHRSSTDLTLRAETADQAIDAVAVFDERRGDDGSRLAFALAAPSKAVDGLKSASFDAYVEHPERARAALVSVVPAGATPGNTAVRLGGDARLVAIAPSAAPAQRKFGDATVGYLPTEARTEGSPEAVSIGSLKGVRQRYGVGRRSLWLTTVRSAPLASTADAMGYTTTQANPHGEVPMVAVFGDGRSGFAWFEKGSTYVVTIDGNDSWAQITGYHVAQAITG